MALASSDAGGIKMYRQELQFLWSARGLMRLYISVKFHENILNGFQVIEQTQLHDRWTDRQMDRHSRQKQNVSTSISGDIILYMSMKFHENILTSLQVAERGHKITIVEFQSGITPKMN